MMHINNKFSIGQVVYLVTDEDQEPHIVLSITVLTGGNLCYLLASGRCEYIASEIEISVDRVVR